MSALLEVQDIGRSFGGLKAVDGVSFDVREGEILGIIGPNGAGKTTLVNLVSGVLRPTGGAVAFAGERVTGLATSALSARGLVRTFQSTAVYGACTVRENLVRGSYLTRYPGVMAALFGSARARLRRAEADALVERLLDDMALRDVADTPAGSLPYGVQKILGIAIALAARPRLLLLDEPVAGLSAAETDQVRDVILQVRASGVTLVVIDHNMRFIAGLCDRLLVVAAGRELVRGLPGDVLRDARVVQAYLGTKNVTAGIA
ncbi:Lipopolysaccharide export system ATP-binding protein LptB [Achromobacter deleyi]|uniref:Lipopolysaccharide export system ATP-binding protein LptB n=1 Tax=Achromobacter deleyi TaxID=1353891 RepID=A0A6S7A2U4_9BURK|nr:MULTISPECIES: ATP-binding cassette domain-containing protein [Achromobacter]CAB3708443.1 Lipopolysaccharide export system ATP-binding protein LptB [Achromobacter deleyi]CAB3838102.1 Lipopolysaccharide export system ATP-binding protein LptB [Achromobacter deleyi]CAB3866657.1 Lipopolysaccharide export system ATP-binding protein LptB [Achromobacter deleyi]CAB3877641.1 Lipopolysaccharide export system ATP-binding protein LptB [Achromobacter deleyi]